MSLSIIFTAVAERMNDPKLNPNTPAVAVVGPDRKDDTSAPPRIAWEPISARRLSPTRIGGGPTDEGDIMRRQWMVKVEFWDVGLDELETLVNRFYATMHDLVSQHGYAVDGQEVWATGGATAKGATCIADIGLVTPIRRTVRPTRTPAIAATYKMNNTAV